MTIGGDLLVDGATQVEAANDGRGPQVEALFHNFRQFVVGQRAGAFGIDEHAYRAGHADGVGDAHFAAAAEAGGDEVFGHMAHGVGGGAIHFAGVLAGEGAAAVVRVGRRSCLR